MARRLVAHGASLVLVDVQTDAVTALARELGDRAIAVVADVSDSETR